MHPLNPHPIFAPAQLNNRHSRSDLLAQAGGIAQTETRARLAQWPGHCAAQAQVFQVWP